MNHFIWGIIGPGNIAKEFADDLALVKNSIHKVGAVLSNKIEKAAVFAEDQDVPQYFESINDFLEKGNINAVYISTPHPLHYKEALICLEHKIPVLCEKPLGMNVRQVKDLISVSKANKTFLMEGIWLRFLPSIVTLLSLIEKGAIGKVISMKASIGYKAPYDHSNRYFNPDLGGGSLMDLGIYPVFLAQLIMGTPTNIASEAILSPAKIDEKCRIFCKYENDENTMIECSLVDEGDQSVIITGEKGSITMQPPWFKKNKGLLLQTNDGNIVPYEYDWNGKGFQYQVEEVYNCIRDLKIESEKMSLAFSLLMAETLETVRKQTGITYPFDDK